MPDFKLDGGDRHRYKKYETRSEGGSKSPFTLDMIGRVESTQSDDRPETAGM